MDALTREEVDARLEAIEARMDGRVADIQAAVRVIEERSRNADARMDRMEATIQATNAAVASLRTTIIITAITAVLATVFGIAAFNATVLSSMVASFESGKNTAAAQAETNKQSEKAAELLRQVQQDLSALRANVAETRQK